MYLLEFLVNQNEKNANNTINKILVTVITGLICNAK